MRWTLAALALVAITVAALRTAGAQTDVAVAPQEAVAGKSQIEWSKAWWQWAASFANDESPVADTTGERCGAKQSGPVWFLAGTYGTRRAIRTCRVPAGKYVFFPVINYVVMPRTSTGDCGAFVAEARRITDGAQYLVVELDGVRVENLPSHRQATECFDIGELATPRYPMYPSAANGYYVMLRPLRKGSHELNFGGRLPSLGQAVTYTLIVE